MVSEITLKKDAEEAIGLFAAEFAYAKKLLEQINQIEQEEPDKGLKDLKKGFRILRWVARAERKADRDEKKVIKDLEEWGSELVQELKLWEERVIEQLKVTEGKIVKAASRFSGDIRKKLLEIETEEQLFEKLSKKGFFEKRRIKNNLAQLFQEVKKEVEQLEHWLSSTEAILGEVITRIREREEKRKQEFAKIEEELVGKKCLMIYRRNSLYDMIKERLEFKYPGQIYAITVPKGTEKIEDDEKKRILKLVEVANKEKILVVLDATMRKWLTLSTVCIEDVIQNLVEKGQGVEVFKKILERVANIAEGYGAKNMVIVITGDRQGAIDEHGIFVERDGKEMKFNGSHSDAAYQVIYQFLKEQFEKRGLKVYPALVNNKWDLLIAKSFESLREEVEHPVTIDIKKTAVFVDRHVRTESMITFAAWFTKHEYNLVEDTTGGRTRNFLYTKEEDVIGDILQHIVKMVETGEFKGPKSIESVRRMG